MTFYEYEYKGNPTYIFIQLGVEDATTSYTDLNSVRVQSRGCKLHVATSKTRIHQLANEALVLSSLGDL